MRKSRRIGGRGISLVHALESRRLLSAGSLNDSAGTLDNSFAGDGVTSANFDTLKVQGNGMAVQADGKIVEVGTASAGQFAVTRFNANGTLDTSFGPNGNGKLTTHVGPADCGDFAYCVAIQSDGKIVIGGFIGLGSDGTSGDNGFVARLLPNGSYDNSFNHSGVIVPDNFDSTFADASDIVAIAIQHDGKIIMVGSEYQGLDPNDNLIIGRLNTDGTLDNSFSSNGKANIDLGDYEDGEAVAIDYNGTAATNSDFGKIVVAGIQTSDLQNGPGFDTSDTLPAKVLLARYNTDGSLDKSFNKSGIVLTVGDVAAKSTDADAVAIEPDGSIVIAGSEGTNLGSAGHHFFLERFTVSGAFDKTFGSTGFVTPTFGSNDHATSLIIGGFGQQLIVGGTSSGNFALAAFTLNGAPDTAFGKNGKVLTPVNFAVPAVNLSLSPNHTIVAAGGTNFNTARYFDVGPNVSVSSLDPTAGPTTHKRVGKLLEPVPNPASMIIARDEALPVATRVYFTISGNALPPNAANVKLKKNNYTLSGMTMESSPANSKIAYVDIPAGQTFTTVTFTPNIIPASTETATFSINPSVNFQTSYPPSQTITLLSNNAPPPPPPTTLTDTADAYVQDGSVAGSNFGTATKLEVKEGSSGFNRISYLKFDLSSLGTVNSVKLNLFGELNNSDATNIVTQLFSVSNTSWSETGITFNNKPTIGSSVLASATIANTTPTMYTFDVTAYVKQQLAAGSKTVSFALKNPSGGSPYVSFNSREAGSNAPTLTAT